MGKITAGKMGGALPYGKCVTGESKNSQKPRGSLEISLFVMLEYKFPFS